MLSGRNGVRYGKRESRNGAEVTEGITSERALQHDAPTANAEIASVGSRRRVAPCLGGDDQRGRHAGGGRGVQRRLGGSIAGRYYWAVQSGPRSYRDREFTAVPALGLGNFGPR